MIVALGGRRGIGWFDDIVDFVEDVADAPFDAAQHIVGKVGQTAGSFIKTGGKVATTTLGVGGSLAAQSAGLVGSTYRSLRSAVPTPGNAAAASAAMLPIAAPSSNMPIILIGVLAVGAVLLLTRKRPATAAPAVSA